MGTEPLPARHIRVGPARPVARIAEAALLARDGDTVEIDAGDYAGDTAVWTQDRLTIRAVGGRARLIAAAQSAEQKAIWVVRGGRVVVENIEFTGARVKDRNGAGIRLERGLLTVRNCVFLDNENGILTSGHPTSELAIERSEFGHNGAGDGFSHNLYVGAIRRLSVKGSYFHHARVGHLLKSRAAENHIYYNRLTDEEGGTASYELEFPSGGVAYVVGNIIQQGGLTQNPVLVSFGAEGYGWPKNQLYLAHNTLVDQKVSNGVFVFVRPGDRQVSMRNNLLFGGGRLELPEAGNPHDNYFVDANDFARMTQHDYRLVAKSRLVRGASPIEEPGHFRLTPLEEYRHPASTASFGPGRLSPGAMQSIAAEP